MQSLHNEAYIMKNILLVFLFVIEIGILLYYMLDILLLNLIN